MMAVSKKLRGWTHVTKTPLTLIQHQSSSEFVMMLVEYVSGGICEEGSSLSCRLAQGSRPLKLSGQLHHVILMFFFPPHPTRSQRWRPGSPPILLLFSRHHHGSSTYEPGPFSHPGSLNVFLMRCTTMQFSWGVLRSKLRYYQKQL